MDTILNILEKGHHFRGAVKAMSPIKAMKFLSEHLEDSTDSCAIAAYAMGLKTKDLDRATQYLTLFHEEGVVFTLNSVQTSDHEASQSWMDFHRWGSDDRYLQTLFLNAVIDWDAIVDIWQGPFKTRGGQDHWKFTISPDGKIEVMEC